MDVNTGHLITGAGYQRLYQDCMATDPKHIKNVMESYVPVPKEMEKAAELKLAGQEEAMVSLTSGGKLSNWAAKERAERRKDKHRRDIQKESRRRNRG